MRTAGRPTPSSVVLVLAACVLAPALLALVATGLGAAGTQGLSEATGALSAAALQGLERRGEPSPLLLVARPVPLDLPLAPDVGAGGGERRAPALEPAGALPSPLRI